MQAAVLQLEVVVLLEVVVKLTRSVAGWLMGFCLWLCVIVKVFQLSHC